MARSTQLLSFQRHRERERERERENGRTALNVHSTGPEIAYTRSNYVCTLCHFHTRSCKLSLHVLSKHGTAITSQVGWSASNKKADWACLLDWMHGSCTLHLVNRAAVSLGGILKFYVHVEIFFLSRFSRLIDLTYTQAQYLFPQIGVLVYV